MKGYDYLIVGSGLFGATFAYLAHQQGKKCLVIDKRAHLGGNIYCEDVEGIHVHKYGAHIFHTSNKRVWDFVNSMVEFNRYTNSPDEPIPSQPTCPCRKLQADLFIDDRNVGKLPDWGAIYEMVHNGWSYEQYISRTIEKHSHGVSLWQRLFGKHSYFLL